MKKQLVATIMPASGFSSLFHILLNVSLALGVFVLVRIEFTGLALALVLLSKWRMFAVRPRFWPASIRVNAIDIIVSLSILLFMLETTSPGLQLAWALLYAAWLVIIKPASSTLMVTIQATTGMLLGLIALFYGLGAAPLYVLVLLTGMVCYFSARHFFDSFDEPYAKLLSNLYAYFGAALTWVLGHWLLFYLDGIIAQPALVLIAVGYGMAALYYLDHHDRLSKTVRVQIMITTLVIMVAILASLIVNVMATVRDLLQ
jgi:hypothetical protein